MTNGFGYFCQNKSNIRAPKICFKKIRLRCVIFLNLETIKISFQNIQFSENQNKKITAASMSLGFRFFPIQPHIKE